QEANLLSGVGHVVRLPKPFDLDQLSQAVSAAGGASGEPARAGPASTAGLRVLLVDDSTAARAHVRGVLKGLGLRDFAGAADGAEAFAPLKKTAYHLLGTDYTIPRLDGRGLLDFICHRSATPAVPVIVVTTETDPAKLAAVRRLGVAAVCDKTFPPHVV